VVITYQRYGTAVEALDALRGTHSTSDTEEMHVPLPPIVQSAGLLFHAVDPVSIDSTMLQCPGQQQRKVAAVRCEDVPDAWLVPFAAEEHPHLFQVSLMLQFRSEISPNPRGLFCVCSGRVLTSHFEVHHARSSFPSPDDPLLRVTWTLSVTVPAQFEYALGNQELKQSKPSGKSVVHTFGVTPRLPAYLLCLVCSSVPWKVAVPRPVSESCALPVDVFALDATAPVDKVASVAALACGLLQDLFQEAWGGERLRLLIVPGIPLGGMEHDGLIFLNQSVCTVTQRDGALSQGCVELIAHEIAHGWMGNRLGLPFTVKEGICLVLEKLVAQAVVTGGRVGAVKRPSAVPTAASLSVAEGKELTGQTYQNALNYVSYSIATQTVPVFMRKIQRLLHDRPFGSCLLTEECTALLFGLSPQ